MNWEQAKQAIVPITREDGTLVGSGFFISPAGHLITTSRVARAPGGVSKLRAGGQTVTAVVLGSGLADFSILQVPDPPEIYLPFHLECASRARFLSVAFHGTPPLVEGFEGFIRDAGPDPNEDGLHTFRIALEIDQHLPEAIYQGGPAWDPDQQCAVGLLPGARVGLALRTITEIWPQLEELGQEFVLPKPMSNSASRRVFISYRSQDPDLNLAQRFYDELRAEGHQPFLAAANISLGEDWPDRVKAELAACDYFLVFLSKASARSEMVIDEVGRALRLRGDRPEGRPAILPIRVDVDFDESFNHDLDVYLSRIHQRLWKGPQDTALILDEVLQIVRKGDLNVASAREHMPVPPTTASDEVPTPHPVARPMVPRGAIDPDSPFYVERPPLEEDCFYAIEEEAALIRIQAPRQMGKTSLMARILHHAMGNGRNYRIANLSLQFAGREVVSDLERFLRWFCERVTRQLQVTDLGSSPWGDGTARVSDPIAVCTDYFELLLKKVDRPVVVALDECDCLFPYPDVVSDFFTMLRGWNDAKPYDSETGRYWDYLRLIVVHSSEYAVASRTSPLANIGLGARPPEFTPEQIADLCRRHGLEVSAAHLDEFAELTGGHPYLVRLALFEIYRKRITWEALLAGSHLETGIYRDHLRWHFNQLYENKTLMTALETASASERPVRVDLPSAIRLEGMGLVRREGTLVTPRFGLYRRYFAAHFESEI